MKRLFQLLLLFIIFLVPIAVLGAESTKFYTITCNPGEDSNTEVRINWHTDAGVTDSYVLYTKKSDTNWDNAVKVETTSIQNDAFTQLNAIGSVLTQNGAVLSNLEPDTQYMYKVTDGSEESSVRYFETGGGSSFSFIWTSDFHAYYDDARRLKAASANIEEAITMNGGVDFILSTGDTIAHGGTYKWWKQLGGASWIQRYMYADVLGNHDWMTSAGTYVENGASNIFFGANHNNPKNGYAGQENICYYFYYGDALFIILNTEEYTKAQYEWAENVLRTQKAQYIFMVQHYQAFNTGGGKNSAGYTRWHELCDKYGVDIFFSGNSHVYIRSNSIYEDKVSTDKSKGTVYMVAPSSDGERGSTFNGISSNADLIAKGWSDGAKTVGCSIVTVSQTGVVTKLIKNGGEVIDVGVIDAKRAPSNRTTKDLSGVDKNAIEESIELQRNSSDLSSPRVKYNEDASIAIRNLIIKNKDTDEVLYEGGLVEKSRYFTLSNVKKGLYNLLVLIEYYDNTSSVLNLEFANVLRWGSVSTIVNKVNGNSINITWRESIDKDVVKGLQAFVNGEYYQDVEIGAKSLKLENLPAGNLKVNLKVIDNEDDIVGNILLADVNIELPKYKVVFKDKDGNVLSETEVEEGASATAPEAPIVDGYTFTGWDKEFDNITSDIEINPIYEKDVITYKVKFYDNSGLVIFEEDVEEGKSATAPKSPEVPGLYFDGWDKDFTNVTSDLDVKPIYKHLWFVVFKGFEGEELKQDIVVDGSNANAPDVPEVEGYRFVKWDKDFDSITKDTVITAVYEKIGPKYTVTFKGLDGSIIETVEVEEGKAAIAPTAPSIDGYVFKGWDKAFNNISSDLEVNAVYESNAKKYTVTFKDKDGKVISEVKVEEGKSATAPSAPDIEGYKFDKWDKSFDNVTTDLVVTAQYKKAGGCGNSATILFTSLMILGLCLIRRKEF